MNRQIMAAMQAELNHISSGATGARKIKAKPVTASSTTMKFKIGASVAVNGKGAFTVTKRIDADRLEVRNASGKSYVAARDCK